MLFGGNHTEELVDDTSNDIVVLLLLESEFSGETNLSLGLVTLGEPELLHGIFVSAGCLSLLTCRCHKIYTKMYHLGY